MMFLCFEKDAFILISGLLPPYSYAISYFPSSRFLKMNHKPFLSKCNMKRFYVFLIRTSYLRFSRRGSICSRRPGASTIAMMMFSTAIIKPITAKKKSTISFTLRIEICIYVHWYPIPRELNWIVCSGYYHRQCAVRFLPCLSLDNR